MHTPGPWYCVDTSNHAHDYRLTDKNGFPLYVNAEANDHSQQRANARLIAAAPELLSAAKDALESLKRLADTDGAYRVTCISELESAIKKALGQ